MGILDASSRDGSFGPSFLGGFRNDSRSSDPYNPNKNTLNSPKAPGMSANNIFRGGPREGNRNPMSNIVSGLGGPAAANGYAGWMRGEGGQNPAMIPSNIQTLTQGVNPVDLDRYSQGMGVGQDMGILKYPMLPAIAAIGGGYELAKNLAAATGIGKYLPGQWGQNNSTSLGLNQGFSNVSQLLQGYMNSKDASAPTPIGTTDASTSSAYIPAAYSDTGVNRPVTVDNTVDTGNNSGDSSGIDAAGNDYRARRPTTQGISAPSYRLLRFLQSAFQNGTQGAGQGLRAPNSMPADFGDLGTLGQALTAQGAK